MSDKDISGMGSTKAPQPLSAASKYPNRAFLANVLMLEDAEARQVLLDMDPTDMATLTHQVASTLQDQLSSLYLGEQSRAFPNPNPNADQLCAGILSKRPQAVDDLLRRLKVLDSNGTAFADIVQRLCRRGYSCQDGLKTLTTLGWNLIAAVLTVSIVWQALDRDVVSEESAQPAIRFARLALVGLTQSLVLDFGGSITKRLCRSTTATSPDTPSPPRLKRAATAPAPRRPSLPSTPALTLTCVLGEECSLPHDNTPVVHMPKPKSAPHLRRAATLTRLSSVFLPTLTLVSIAPIKITSEEIQCVREWVERGASEEARSPSPGEHANLTMGDSPAVVASDAGELVVPVVEVASCDEFLVFDDDKDAEAENGHGDTDAKVAKDLLQLGRAAGGAEEDVGTRAGV